MFVPYVPDALGNAFIIGYIEPLVITVAWHVYAFYNCVTKSTATGVNAYSTYAKPYIMIIEPNNFVYPYVKDYTFVNEAPNAPSADFDVVNVALYTLD